MSIAAAGLLFACTPTAVWDVTVPSGAVIAGIEQYGDAGSKMMAQSARWRP